MCLLALRLRRRLRGRECGHGCVYVNVYMDAALARRANERHGPI